MQIEFILVVFVRRTIRATNPIPKREILAVVAVVKEVMVRMVRSAIDGWFENCRKATVSVVYRYRPQVDEGDD